MKITRLSKLTSRRAPFLQGNKINLTIMKKYIARVQLKDAEQTDYEKLDSEMEKERFARVKLQKASTKENPASPREYNFHGGITLQQVTAAAYRAASKTGKKYSFTVMKEKAVVSA